MKTRIFVLMLLILCFGACTKVVVYGTDNITKSMNNRYLASKSGLFHQCIRALDQMGYNLNEVDEDRGTIVTGWRPTASSSHYLLLFDHKDFSANAGSYYQIILKIEDQGPYAGVDVSTRVRSVSGKLSSHHLLEKKFLAKLSDFMRSPQIEITNVGQKDR